jgi:hypothetical protein
MKIQVTQKDIDRAQELRASSRPQFCPIALAAKRATHRRVSVGSIYLRVFRSDDNWKDYRLLKEARNFIRRFDGHINVEPFEFETE